MSFHSEALAVPGSRNSASGLLVLIWLVATMALWLFAFYEVPTDGSDWVRRAQVACFGSDESGLPGPAGWMLLILSPLALLGAMVLSLGQEISACVQTAAASPRKRWILAFVGMLLVTEGFWVGARISSALSRNSAIPASGIPLELPRDYPRGTELAPDFRLLDQHGNIQTLSAFRGRPILISFVFAHCRTVCPVLVKTLQRVSQESASLGTAALFLTLDPWRDTPAALPGLAKSWNMGPDTFVLSGDPVQVNSTLDAYQVPRGRNGQNGDVVHPAVAHVIDKDGRLAYSFSNPSAEWLREAVARVSK